MIQFTKNKNYIIEITDLGKSGEGIGKLDNLIFFIPRAIPGEIVEVKLIKLTSNYAIGKLVKILKKSSNRILPVCSIFGRCGGCQIQHINYQTQLKFKQKIIKDNIERIAKISNPKILPIISAEKQLYYRNKVQFAIGKISSNPQIGLYQLRSHNIIDTNECLIQNPITNIIVKKFKEFLIKTNISIYNEKTHTGLIRHILIRSSFFKNKSVLTIILNGISMPYKKILIKMFQTIPELQGISININTNQTDTILGSETKTIYGNSNLIEKIANNKFIISPESFFQINPIQTEKMIEIVKYFANLTGNEIIWDAYCGTGLFAISLAKQAKSILGVEINPKAIKNAKENALLNHINNIEFKRGACEKIFLKNKLNPDLIIIDPPRKGCDKILLDTIIKSKPQKIIYVSCNSATLARDLNYLTLNGFSFVKNQPIDFFPQTIHVESISLLQNQEISVSNN